MSKISDMYEQIKQQQYLLVKTKLQEAIKANLDKRELSEQEEDDYAFSYDEIEILKKLLKENGLDFFEFAYADYDLPIISKFLIKVNNNLVKVFTDNLGTKDIPSIVSVEELREKLREELGEIYSEIDLEQILRLSDIDIDSLGIKPSSSKEIQSVENETVEEAKAKAIEARENLVRAKLKQSIKDLMEGKEQSENNSLCDDNEIYILLGMLEKSGLEPGKDFNFGEEPFGHGPAVPELNMRIGDYILYFSGMSSITDIMAITELEGSAILDEEDAYWLKLRPIELEKLGINIETLQRAEEETIYLEDYVYDLVEHRVIEDKKHDIEPDYVYDAMLEDVIESILRHSIIDTNANAMFHETGNYCEIGRYDDMPGEEEVALILNSVDRKILQAYFEKHPDDIKLFEDIRKEHDDVQPIEETHKPSDAHEKMVQEMSDGDEFTEKLVRYALERAEEREKEAKAKQLSKEYEEQLPKEQHSLDDND